MTKLCFFSASVSLFLSALSFSKVQYSWQETPEPSSPYCSNIMCSSNDKVQTYTFENLDESGMSWHAPTKEKVVVEDLPKREYVDESERNPFFTKMEERVRSPWKFKDFSELKSK